MQELVDNYAAKMVTAGRAAPGRPVVGGPDAEGVWNRPDPACTELEKVFAGLNINSLLFSQPAEPYRSIIEFLAAHNVDASHPSDCETRTFMHDLPIVPGEVGAGPHGLCHTLPPAMQGRHRVIVYGHGLFTVGRTDFNDAFKHLLSGERECRAEYMARIAALG